jgi:excisionase family DNA binding protein
MRDGNMIPRDQIASDDSHDDLDRLLTVPEAAKLLHLAPGTVSHLVSQRRLPVIRISSRCIRFSRKALLFWLDGLTLPAEESPAARSSKTKGRSQNEPSTEIASPKPEHPAAS